MSDDATTEAFFAIAAALREIAESLHHRNIIEARALERRILHDMRKSKATKRTKLRAVNN